jgi:hypothetical protein
MDKIEVYALDDDGNRIEPQQEVEQKEEEVSQEVLNQETPEQVKEENELPQQEEESSKGQEQEQVEEEDQEKLLTEEPEKDDNWFLSRLKDRYEVELNSIDDLKNVLSNTDKEKENLPEDVEKYMEFRKETGRSFSDFAELQKDWATVGDGDILRQYYEQTKPHLDREDIEHILNEQFSYDQEIDDDKDIRAKKIAHKEALYEARNHFEKLKEKYKAPLGSSEADIPETYKEAFSFYNEYKTQNEKDSIARKEQASYFTEKTNSLFSDEFKGFEFNLGDEKKVFKPSDLDKVKSNQSNVQNFISQHVDEKGFLKDPATYHRSLYTAMNPDAIAKHFYEQGKSDATGDIIKETKNIDMGVRENTVTDTGGTKFRIVESEDKFEFKIKKRN